MKHNYINFAVLLSTAYVSCQTIQSPFDEAIREKFAQSNFALVQEPTQPASQEPEQLSWLENMKKQIQNALPKPELTPLTDRARFETAFNSITPQNIMNEIRCAELEDFEKIQLISNNQNSQTIFNELFNQNMMTQAGIVWALYTISHPTTDTHLIQSRQNAVMALVQDTSLCNQLSPLFAKMCVHDHGVWRFWYGIPVISNAFEKSIYFSMPGLSKLNTSTVALEADKYFMYSLMTLQNILSFSTPIMLPLILGSAHTIPEALNEHITTLKNINNPHFNFLAKFLAVYSTILTPFAAGANLYTTYAALHNNELGIQAMHSALNDIAAYIKELKKVARIIKENSQLLDVIPNLQHVLDLVDISKHSASFNKLLAMLDTNTFISEPSFIRLTGRVKAAYKLLKECKDEFLPAFAAAGQLEGTLALANLINTHKSGTARYCFAEFVDAQKPQIDIVNFWNPLVDVTTVITNSLTLGGTLAQNIILTGPNTGGKTTIIKSLVISLILAQTFGIVPASSCTLTPFSKINCFMDIQDNIAAGTSLFKAEVNRAKELMVICKNCAQNNGFVFTIMDEVFTSTSPKEGENAAYRFIQKLGSFENSIAILATHYPKMTELETHDPHFSNYHVEVIRNADNSLTRTFKLKYGPSFMNIAADILQDEGIFDE